MSNQVSVYNDAGNFEHAQRVAKSLSVATFVPEAYRGNVANCLVAIEMANRLQMPPLMVMQNLHIIHGRPSWSSSFLIAAVNSSGRFTPLTFRMSGDGDNRQCIAVATDKATGEVLEGVPVSIAMAKAEGWYTKNGSKWKTMPELMLRYRAAAFFSRLYCPEITMAMHTAEEQQDIQPTVVRPAARARDVAALLDDEAEVVNEQPVDAPPPADTTDVADDDMSWLDADTDG